MEGQFVLSSPSIGKGVNVIHSQYSGRLAKVSDIPAILALQQANLVRIVAVQERDQFGCVGIETPESLLQELMEERLVMIVEASGQTAAYFIGALPEQAPKMPPLLTLLQRRHQLEYQGGALNGYELVIGVQAVVAKQFRGQGIARCLYNTVRKHLKARYDLIYSEISTANQHSLKVHQHLGFRVLDQYAKEGADEGTHWAIVIYDLQQEPS